MRFGIIHLSLVTFFAASTLAHASTTTYSDSSSFNAATTNVVDYTFPAPPAGFQTFVGVPYTDGPFVFQPVVNGEYNLLNDGEYGAGVPYLEYASEDHPTWTIDVDGTSALAFFIADSGQNTPLSVAINGVFAGTVTTPSTDGTTSFFGVTSTDPITTLTITGDDLHTVFDMTGFEAALPPTSPVPEPTSLALLATGLTGIASAIKRRRS